MVIFGAFGVRGYAAEGEGSQQYEAVLKARGTVFFRLKEPQKDGWGKNVTGLYLREAGSSSEPFTEKDLVDKAKYKVTDVRVDLDSNLFPVKPGTEVNYEMRIESKEAEPMELLFKVKNLRPSTFTIRQFDKEGKVTRTKTYSYEEMEGLCKAEGHYSAGCVMHGLFSFRAQGVLLEDLLADAGFEFKPGMSLACRAVDAPEEIKATELFSSKPTGIVFKNPEKYWIKPRYTHSYKHTYENLMGRERYFLTPQWEDAEIGKTLKDDGIAFSFGAREVLVSKPEYLKPVKPMIAIRYTELQYPKNQEDIRTYKDEFYDLTAEETAFRFLYGLGMDEDPVTNVLSRDQKLNLYPVAKNPENEGKPAIEEGIDPCGTSGRQAMLVFGIDIFEDGSVN